MYHYLRILDTVLSFIITCNLLIFQHFPEEDKQYIYRKFRKIFFSIILPAEFHKKTETYL